jgi:hypothetical protein
MKSLTQYIHESIDKQLKDMASCWTIGHHAGKFSKKDIKDCLEYVHDYKGLDDIQVTAWDQKNPRTCCFKYNGIEGNVMKFQYHHNDEFVNKDIYSKILMDLDDVEGDEVMVEFDNGVKWVQSCSVFQDDFYQKDAIILTFEG